MSLGFIPLVSSSSLCHCLYVSLITRQCDIPDYHSVDTSYCKQRQNTLNWTFNIIYHIPSIIRLIFNDSCYSVGKHINIVVYIIVVPIIISPLILFPVLPSAVLASPCSCSCLATAREAFYPAETTQSGALSQAFLSTRGKVGSILLKVLFHFDNIVSA